MIYCCIGSCLIMETLLIALVFDIAVIALFSGPVKESLDILHGLEHIAVGEPLAD